MRLSPTTGKILGGVGGGSISINGAVPASLAAYVGGGWGWLDDNTCGGQASLDTVQYQLKQLVVSTDTLTNLEGTLFPSDAATQFRAGNSKWAAFLTSGASKGVRSTITSQLPVAALGDIDSTGRMAVVQNYLADNGIVIYSSAGAVLSTRSTSVVDGSNRLRMNGGVVAYQNTDLSWHLGVVTSTALSPFAPRTDETIAAMVPVLIGTSIYVVELSNTKLTIRLATSSSGFVIATSANLFNPDAIQLSAGVARIGYSITTGENPTDLRCADLTLSSGGLTTGTTSSGSLVLTAQTPLTASSFPVGPIEGDVSSTRVTLPQHEQFWQQDKVSGNKITQPWYAALSQLNAVAGDPVDASTDITGILQPEHGGTGVTTGLSVLDGQNITDGSLPISAIEDQPESTLLGRGQGSGDGPVQDITLGTGLSMTGTVLSASGGGSWIPLVTGAEPPVLVSDGAGHLILVAYP